MKDLIVMSGGGFSQVESGLGCLKALAEKGLRVNSQFSVDYRSTSAGAICSALMSAGLTPEAAIDLIRANPTGALISKRWFWPVRLLLGQSIYARPGMEAMLKKYVPSDPLINVEVSVTRVADMKNLKLQASYSSVLASGSIEGIFDPVPVGGAACIDGGYTDNVPYEARMQSQYRHIFIILYPDDPVPDRHLTSMIGRLLTGFSVKLSQEVDEAERVYDNTDHYPNITVLRPTPVETSLLSWSEDYSLVTHAYEYARKRLERSFPDGIQ